jgi:hypothetical protein
MLEVHVSDDIPSLTLRVLEKIQGDLSGLRADTQDVKAELRILTRGSITS